MDGPTNDLAAASAHLPERQREALELCELERLSYEEIAQRMGAGRESVAQLIAHGWINLYDELEGTALASVAPSPECERALALIAARDDGELDAESPSSAWLDSHLEECDRCRRGVEEMARARRRYGCQRPAVASSRRRPAVLIAGLAALLLVTGVAAAFVRDDSPPTSADQAVGAAQKGERPLHGKGASGGDAESGAKRKANQERNKEKTAEPAPTEAYGGESGSTAAPVPSPAASGASPDGGAAPPNDRGGEAGVQPTRRTSSSPPARPKPASASPSPAVAAETPPSIAEAPVEEPVQEPPRRREPPGKPADRPPR